MDSCHILHSLQCYALILQDKRKNTLPDSHAIDLLFLFTCSSLESKFYTMLLSNRPPPCTSVGMQPIWSTEQ